jgi:hypothetical protein
MNNPSNQNTASKKKPSSWANAGIQCIKRARADAFIGANPNLSYRTLARLAVVSHAFISLRRKLEAVLVAAAAS